MDNIRGRRALAFVSYNPYQDERIAPKTTKDLWKYPELPECIHDAIRRAKTLTEHLTQEELIGWAIKIEKWSLSAALHMGDFSEYTWASADQSDDLLGYLKNNEHDIPLDEWPKLFGILALSLAGEIVNILWPSESYLEHLYGRMRDPQRKMEAIQNHQSEKGAVLGLAIEAVRAVGFGEGFRIARDMKQKLKQQQKNSSIKAAEAKNLPAKKIRERFAAYYESNKEKLPSKQKAAERFLEREMSAEDKQYIRTAKTLVESLNPKKTPQ